MHGLACHGLSALSPCSSSMAALSLTPSLGQVLDGVSCAVPSPGSVIMSVSLVWPVLCLISCKPMHSLCVEALGLHLQPVPLSCSSIACQMISWVCAVAPTQLAWSQDNPPYLPSSEWLPFSFVVPTKGQHAVHLHVCIP